MKVNSLKEFKALVKACRSLGIDAMEVDGIKFNLGRLPQSSKYIPEVSNYSVEADIKVPQFNGPITDVEVPATEQLTEEQLLYYSAQGHNELEQ